MPPAPDVARETLARRLREQATWCRELGSEFSGILLDGAAEDVEAGGPTLDVLAGFESEADGSALALRLLGAIQRQVLLGELPEVGRHYPSVGGDGDASAAWPAFRAALAERREAIRRLVARPCQTNEVGRSAALLGGFLEVARRTRLPLRLLEIGASAGLNMRWDQYRYEAADRAWGDPASPVQFKESFGVPPPMHGDAQVVERRGCDLRPIDPTSPDGSLTLRSFIWPDQPQRLRRLEGAIEVARRVPATVEQMDAASFLKRELASPRAGVATVAYHSVFIQYVDRAGRAGIAAAIEGAQAAATTEAPVAYLRMEPGRGTIEVRLGDELLGTATAHGAGVRWLVS